MLGSVLATWATIGWAQDYPTRTVTIVARDGAIPVVSLPPEELRRFGDRETERWGKCVPVDRVQILRHAFDATARDSEFLADVEKQKVELFPITGENVAALVRRIYATPQDVLEIARQISAGR